MKAVLPLLAFLCSLEAGGGSCGRDWQAAQAEILALASLTRPPAWNVDEGRASTDSLKAVYFDGLPWRGNPTRIFAWMGLPEQIDGKVPGIVLVHGGGGSAFKEWVMKWNAHGFAAIAIAVEGQTDERDPAAASPANPQCWKRSPWPGPARAGIYGDSGAPLRDQWMYHAVAGTILANSLLRSLPEVDANKVGVMGISWGGVVTSTVIGIDTRFAFAIPTYGCGGLADAANQYGKALGDNDLYRRVWDPMVRLGRAALPTLWLSWPGEQPFPLDCLASSAAAMPGEAVFCLIPGMKHSHPAGWTPPDSYAFARSVVETGRPWCRATDIRVSGPEVLAVFESTKELDGAVLVSATGVGITGSREWTESAAVLKPAGPGRWEASAVLPDGATAWFINVRSGGLTVSSGYREFR